MNKFDLSLVMSLRSLIFIISVILALIDNVQPRLNLNIQDTEVGGTARLVESHRILQGTLGPNVPDWHLAQFYSRAGLNHMIGNAIIVDSDFIIANRQIGLDPVREDAFADRSAFLPTPHYFSALKGITPNGGHTFRYYFAGEPVTPYLGYRNRMAVYELGPEASKHEFIKLELTGANFNDEIPTPDNLEWFDGTLLCTAYAWTKLPITQPGNEYNDNYVNQAMGKFRRPKEVAFYSQFDVYVNCSTPRCTANATNIKVCDRFADDGIPVICGRDKKLTFILTHLHTNPDCQFTFEAYHVEPLLSLVKKLRERRQLRAHPKPHNGPLDE